MPVIFKIIQESFRQAWHSLVSNKLRSFLSLLGISIGIFCIIGVLSAVDSLEDNVRSSLDRLGNDVVYVDRFSWGEDPGQNYWKWRKNPSPSFNDYKAVLAKSQNADLISFYSVVGTKTAKYRSSSVEGGFVIGVTEDSGEMFGFEYAKGRNFSSSEYRTGAPKVILGAIIAEELFGNIEPIGKRVSIAGRKLEVVGVLEKKGESLVNIFNFDEGIIISYELAKKYANLKENFRGGGTAISVKAKEGVRVEDLKDEMRGIIRARRRLKPKEKDNFALNELSLLSNVMDSVFSVLNSAGAIIGIFALIVGVFSVANIMFVSVKERTNLIGIKKALGAKRYIILMEFLIESVILCVIGGLLGMVLIWGVLTIATKVINFELYLDTGNILLGLAVSVLTGVLAGVIPAVQAARLDPVVAMRG